MPIKSFRGKLADLSSETIHLHTNNGSTGYRIKKFELFGIQPGQIAVEHVCQLFTIDSGVVADTTLYDNVDFSDPTLIGAAFYKDDLNYYNPGTVQVVFDNVIFNQDIYLTHAEVKGSAAVNYHIELEQVKLSLDENTVATLKDIRNIKSQ